MKGNISRLNLPLSATIKEALERLSETGRQVVFVVDDRDRIVGCITDGDIRRTLLRGEPLSAPAEKAARKSFVSVTGKVKSSEILKMMLSKGVRQVPILDATGRLVAVRTMEEFVQPIQEPLSFPVVIMAGGQGLRLRPFTETMPKALLKVGDRALIERIIIDLQSKGLRDFYITVNYLAQQIIEYLGNGERFGCTINYVHESEDRPLGTAGSLSLLRNKIAGNFLVINCDVLSTLDTAMFSSFHEEHDAVATVCAKVFTVNVPFGVVNSVGNDVRSIDEKPDLSLMINAGIYFFSPEIFQHVGDGERLDMPALLRRLIELKRPVKCFQSSEPWVDIGSHFDFERAQKNLEYLVR